MSADGPTRSSFPGFTRQSMARVRSPMPFVDAPVEGSETIQQAIERRQRQWAGACYGDYAFHTMLLGKIAPERLGELAEAVQAGHASVKMFTTDITPSRKGRMVDFGDIWEVLKA